MAKNKAKMNKFLTGAITATMVASAVAPVAALADTVDFSDVPTDSSHYPNIVKAAERGLMTGYADGTFKPTLTMNRGQVVKALGKYLVGQEGVTLDAYLEKHDLVKNVTPFEDVPATHVDQELFKYSLVVKDAEAFTGNQNHLNPTNDITRQQMAKVLVNAFDLKDIAGVEADVADMDTVFGEYKEYVSILSKHEVTKADDGKFRPAESVTRQQMASFLNRSYTAIHGDEDAVAAVQSVSATNQTTLTLSGTGLKGLEAEDIAVENNSVKSVTANANGTSATVVLDSELAVDVATKVTIDEKDFTVTYSIDAKKLEVVEATYDDDTKNQYVAITVDGKTLNAQELINAGYNVKFEAYATKAAKTEVNNLFADDETGKLYDDLDSNGFVGEIKTGETVLPTDGLDVYVKVTAVKGTEVITSEIGKIKIQNIDLAASGITDFVLTNSDGFEQNSSTLVAGETADISEITVKAGSEEEDITAGYTLESSDKSVITVDGTTITAQGPGTATLTIKYGGVTKTQKITVTNEAREMNKVELAKSNLKVGKDQVADSKIYLFDQYGDPMADDVKIKVSDEEIVEVSADGTTKADYDEFTIDNDPDAETKIYVKGLKEGSATVTFRDADDVKIGTATLKVSVSENIDLQKFELTVDNDISDADVTDVETAAGASDLTKDDIAEKAEVDFGANGEKYVKIDLKALNAQGFELKDGQTDEGNYTVKSNPSRAGVITDVYEADGFIVVEAGDKTGSATIEVTSNDDSKVKASIKVNVVDKGYNVTGITFKSFANPTYAQTINYEDVLTHKEVAADKDPVISGVKLTKETSYPIRLDVNDTVGNIYIDKDANGVYDEGERIVGKLELTSTGTFATAPGTDILAGAAVVSGDDGTLLFKVVDNAGKVVATKAIEVDF